MRNLFGRDRLVDPAFEAWEQKMRDLEVTIDAAEFVLHVTSASQLLRESAIIAQCDRLDNLRSQAQKLLDQRPDR